ASLSPPVATEVARLLDEAARDAWGPGLVRALAAVATHAETGDVLASRVFAARYLGDSKALGVLRPRLERLLGPLDGLGIRDGASPTFVDGVRIVRLVAEWFSGAVEPFGMSPEHVAAAPARRPLSPRSAAAIRADLAARPAALLADTLRALLAYDCWVEQEAFLGATGRGAGALRDREEPSGTTIRVPNIESCSKNWDMA